MTTKEIEKFVLLINNINSFDIIVKSMKPRFNIGVSDMVYRILDLINSLNFHFNELSKPYITTSRKSMLRDVMEKEINDIRYYIKADCLNIKRR